jgi:hypothetical protein
MERERWSGRANWLVSFVRRCISQETVQRDHIASDVFPIPAPWSLGFSEHRNPVGWVLETLLDRFVSGIEDLEIEIALSLISELRKSSNDFFATCGTEIERSYNTATHNRGEGRERERGVRKGEGREREDRGMSTGRGGGGGGSKTGGGEGVRQEGEEARQEGEGVRQEGREQDRRGEEGLTVAVLINGNIKLFQIVWS